VSRQHETKLHTSDRPSRACRASGLKRCNGLCRDLTSDTGSCGDCRTTCAVGDDCIQGVCTSPPPDTTVGDCDNPVVCPTAPSCNVYMSVSGQTSCYSPGDSCPQESCQSDDECAAVSDGGICAPSKQTCCDTNVCVYPDECEH